jgi:hypothetical protein
MIPDDPKPTLHLQCLFQLIPLIPSDLGPLAGALKRPAAAVRFRLWPRDPIRSPSDGVYAHRVPTPADSLKRLCESGRTETQLGSQTVLLQDQ